MKRMAVYSLVTLLATIMAFGCERPTAATPTIPATTSVVTATGSPPTPPPTAAPTPRPAEFRVGDLVFDPEQTAPGDTVKVGARVTNTGGTRGTCTAVLTVDGERTESKQVSLDAGASGEVIFKESHGRRQMIPIWPFQPG
ncbi:MAG: hypothetical protein HYY29_06130 [Chloroflexi bacterium]|nr:hypothetical protein [Chloroflexota bacterium]